MFGFQKITSTIKAYIQKLRLIMASRRFKNFLVIGTVATTAFLAGKYYHKLYVLNTCYVQNKPGLPIYGTTSVDSVDNLYKQVNEINSSSSVNKNFSESLKDIISASVAKASELLPVSCVQAAVPDTLYEPSRPNRTSQIMKYGFPGLSNIRSFDNYVLSYDRRNRVAHWVFEHLTKESIKSSENVSRENCEFIPDESIHPLFRSDNSDYKRSGYDRGHLAAAGNHKSNQRFIEQTFYLSNMAPQVGKGFNRDSWNRLERYVRKLTKTYKNVYCCTGPLYLPKRESNGKLYVKYEVIGANHVAVPTHFYKVIVGETPEGKLEMESYVMGNEVIDDRIPLENFKVPPQTIEKAAGLLFFDNISRDKISKINGTANK